MISIDRTGGRTIQLLIPFEYKGKKVEAIVLAPMRFGDVLRWNDGDWPNMIALLTELAHVDEAVIRELRYPDVDRVMEAFMSLLIPDIRDDIVNNRVPLKKQPEQPQQPVPQPRATNGGSEEPLRGPGAPLPMDTNPGFDLSEDPMEAP
jgi:hypothetical protein